MAKLNSWITKLWSFMEIKLSYIISTYKFDANIKFVTMSLSEPSYHFKLITGLV